MGEAPGGNSSLGAGLDQDARGDQDAKDCVPPKSTLKPCPSSFGHPFDNFFSGWVLLFWFFTRLVHQARELCQEFSGILEGTVHRGKSYIGNLVQLAKMLHDHLANHTAIDLFFHLAEDLLLDLAGQVLNLVLTDRAFLAGNPNPGDNLISLVRLPASILFDNHEQDFIHMLVGGEAAVAFETLSPSPDRGSPRHGPRIDYMIIISRTVRTTHQNPLLPFELFKSTRCSREKYPFPSGNRKYAIHLILEQRMISPGFLYTREIADFCRSQRMIPLRFLPVIEILRNVSIFSGASDELLAQAACLFTTNQVERGKVICRIGEAGRNLFIIRTGQVRISIPDPENSQELTLNYLGPGDYFGEMSLLSGEPISANVTTTLPTTLSALGGDEFNRLCEENPILYRGISQTLSHRLRETNLKRFESRRGQVIRFISEHTDVDPHLLSQQIKNITQLFKAEVSDRTLVVIPHLNLASSLEDALTPQEIDPAKPFAEPHNPPLRQEELTEFFSDLAGRMKDQTFRLVSWASGVDVLFWSNNQIGPKQDALQILNDILLCLRETYRFVLAIQVNQPIGEVLPHVPPDDHLVLLIDLSLEDSQRPASKDEYNRCVPEGDRYPPAKGEKYWVLTRRSFERIQHLAKKVRNELPEKHRLHIALMHRRDRPLLDFPLVKKAFVGTSVHPLPVEIPGVPMETVLTVSPAVSTAIQLSQNPTQALARIVRDLGGHQVGLALGGGGARGLAHIGVIKVLEDEGIPLDLLAGSSFGAVVAAAYAVGRSAQRLVDDMRYHWSHLGNFLLDVFDYNIPRTALLRGRKIRRMIDIAMADETIEGCPVPVYVVCTDLITGREVVLDRGKLGEAIWASGSLPGVFKPVRWGNHLLVDGAVLNKVPARVLREKGARVIIAVNVTPEKDIGLEVASSSDQKKEGWIVRIPVLKRFFQGPNILRIISRSLSIAGLYHSRIHKDAIDIEIKPRIENFDFLRFDQYDQIIEAGMEATRKALPEIRAALDKNRC